MKRHFVTTLVVLVCLDSFNLPGYNLVASPTTDSQENKWNARLETLHPSRPIEYFELAEEVADVATNEANRELARHLFSLSASLDSNGLGTSACIALADMSDREAERLRYLALASLLEPKHSQRLQDLLKVEKNEATLATLITVTEIVSHYRQGDGALALEAMRHSEAREFLHRHEHVLPGGWERFEDDCKRYRGNAKPSVSEHDAVRLLLFEEALLAGSSRMWSSDLVLNAGQPLIEVNSFHLDQSLDVDSSRPYFRGGEWVQRPSTNPAEP